MSDYLFVYGTLLPGLAPAPIARAASRLLPVGEGFVRGILYDLGRYPGAVADPESNKRIAGVVAELPDDPGFLKQLDDYEGLIAQSPETSEFVRERQTAHLADGRRLECWFYCYNGKPDRSLAIEENCPLGSRWGKR